MFTTQKWSLYFATMLMICCLFACGETAPTPEEAKEKAAKMVEEEFKDCKYKPPVAVFSEDLSQVSGHSFELKDREGIELISFKNGMDLELIQNGCDKITQYYNFTIPGEHEGDAAYWTDLAIEQFQYVGSVDEKYAVLAFWGQAIGGRKNDFQLGQAVEVQPGFYAEVNKVISPDHAIVTVKLSEK